jgi:SNF2 family DNA or RNA helicase
MKPTLKGYKNVPKFRAAMRPFFYGRSQRQVKEPLPRLTTRIHPIDLDEEQIKLLLEDIPSGAYELPPALIKVRGEWHEKARDPDNEMTMLSVYQLVANHPALLDPRDSKMFTKHLSPKEETLLDLLDGDLKGEKVIVFSKYRSHIDRLEAITKNGHFTERKFLRITGAEKETQRELNKRKFQDPDGDYDLIVINSAATEGVNLQQAAHLICLDMPWSLGSFLQLIGRMLRMASPHAACTLHVLCAKGSVDEYVIETIKGKKMLFEAIFGESYTAGLFSDGGEINLDSGMEAMMDDEEFLKLLKAHAKSAGMSLYIKGEMLADAKDDAQYKMVFEPGAKKKERPTRNDNYDPDEFDNLW